MLLPWYSFLIKIGNSKMKIELGVMKLGHLKFNRLAAALEKLIGKRVTTNILITKIFILSTV